MWKYVALLHSGKSTVTEVLKSNLARTHWFWWAVSSEKSGLSEYSWSIKSHCPRERNVVFYPALSQSLSHTDFCNVILVAAHAWYLALGSDSCMSFKESRALNLFIMLPCVLLPYKLGTSLQLVLQTQECETLLKTLEQVNKTYKQKVCALVITPLALGAHSTTCWTNVLLNIHSQNVRTVGTTCRKKRHPQILYFLLIWKKYLVLALNVIKGFDHN